MRLKSGSDAVIQRMLSQRRRDALVGLMLASGLAFGLFACAGPDDSKEKALYFADHPAGAIPPVGLEQIKYGMHQREVLLLLRGHHKVIHAADAGPSVGPISDAFQYVESGQTKWAQIDYTDDGRVYEVYFGYEELRRIE